LAYVAKDTKHFPVYLAQWKDAAQLTGGFPKQSGWHRLAIHLTNDKVEVYWNDHKLPGGPFRTDRSERGFIGVYANVTGGLGIAETKVDGLRVWRAD
jgi:hypothetical protein